MSTPLRILIVEDSEDDLFLLLHELRKGGYDPDYLSVCTPKGMSQALTARQWDVVTSDYNMPGFSALAALKLLQESGLDIPFIVVSGKIGEDQAVAAMKAGAHDYVMKQNLSRLAPALEREIREAGERRMRREAEIALNRQFAQFRTIFDAMTAIVYVADMTTYEVIYMNRYASSLFGEDWQGRLCYGLFQNGKDSPCEYCTNPLLVKDGTPQPAITSEHLNKRNGRWYQWTDRAIEWTDGRMVRLQIAIDITDIKEMERIKDEMISAVSHEMRTPLTAMLGFTEFLLDNEVDPQKQRGILETIHKETERLNELIGNFLDMQRLKSETGSFSGENISVAALINGSARLFSCTKDMHQVVVDCPPDLPTIKGDSEKLHQVMINLLSNACKYSPAGSQVTISARASADEVIIAVEDEGIGIAPDLRLKVFERFYRIDNSDRRMVGGTGLGLSLVKDIVDAHHGRVWIEANSPAGCRVMFAIPKGYSSP
jgi:signal transduction histidine kinase/FixJ family two-component response regulator